MRRHHTGPIPPKGQRTIDRAAALIEQGKSNQELAEALNITRATARQYRSRLVCRSANRPPRACDVGEPHCPRCSLRGEHVCLPDSAVAYMRSGEPAADGLALPHMVW